jgi:sortase A
MFQKQKLENVSVEELEQALLLKKRQARLERFQRLSGRARSTNEALLGEEWQPAKKVTAPAAQSSIVTSPERPKSWRDTLLLGLEVTAVIGLVAVLTASYFNLRELNDEVAVAQQNLLVQEPAVEVAPAAPIALARLPGGHTPPTAPGGAMPDVPLHLQAWVQPATAASASAAAVEITKPEVMAPTRIVIPKINVDAPIVNGVNWEDLKKGVGHLPGSAHPGQRGNLYLAAHNDIYGEIFRYLGDLEIGDDYFIYAGEQKFHYVVKERRIIEPTEVDVMMPTTEPVSTLQTCYPYLIDTHRLIVVGELAE